MKRAVSREYKKLIITPEQVAMLAKVCFEPWKRDLESAKRKWRNERLPEIEKQIDEHNKDVKAKKSVYSFNTYLPIGEGDKKAIIEKERDYYIFTSQRVYQFLSKFKVVLKDEELEYTKPDFLESLDLEKAGEIEFSVKSRNGNKSVELTIRAGGVWNEKLEYKIEGVDDRWINRTKKEIENIIDGAQKPHEITRYKSLIGLISALFLSITLFKTINKFPIFGFFADIFPSISLVLVNTLATFLFFIFLAIKLLRIINPLFPTFAVKSDYNPFDSNFIKVSIFFITCLLSPVIFAVFQFLFSK